MSLLTLENVTKRFSTGRREHVALRDVSLDIEPGELVGVWGLRRSGRTTLLRVAAGIEAPDEGVVAFAGQDLARDRSGVLGNEIGYTNVQFMPSHGGTVVDHVAVGLLASGIPLDRARGHAYQALARVGAGDCADLDPRLLDPAETARVGLARAIVTKPRLLLVDDPTNGVDLLQRDPILALIRSFADDGVAVVLTVGDIVTIADRMLSIDEGELRGDVAPEPALVVPLRAAVGRPSA
jgi:ABC-type multidrug transport system ATPase subunit